MKDIQIAAQPTKIANLSLNNKMDKIIMPSKKTPKNLDK